MAEKVKFKGFLNRNPNGQGFHYLETLTDKPWYQTETVDLENGYSRPFSGYGVMTHDGVLIPSYE